MQLIDEVVCDMKNDKKKNSRKKPNSPGRDSQEIGVIRVFSRPGPDAEDRLRRLLTLMVRHATKDGRYTPGVDAPADDWNAQDPTELGPPADGHGDGSGDEREGHGGV